MPLLISDLVLLEILWVLRSAYGFSREAVLGAIQDLACLPCICFQSHNRIQEFIRLGLSTPFDLDDILIGLHAKAIGADSTLTFDQKAV